MSEAIDDKGAEANDRGFPSDSDTCARLGPRPENRPFWLGWGFIPHGDLPQAQLPRRIRTHGTTSGASSSLEVPDGVRF